MILNMEFRVSPAFPSRTPLQMWGTAYLANWFVSTCTGVCLSGTPPPKGGLPFGFPSQPPKKGASPQKGLPSGFSEVCIWVERLPPAFWVAVGFLQVSGRCVSPCTAHAQKDTSPKHETASRLVSRLLGQPSTPAAQPPSPPLRQPPFPRLRRPGSSRASPASAWRYRSPGRTSSQRLRGRRH